MTHVFAIQTEPRIKIKKLAATKASGEDVPVAELWLWRNQEAINSVQRGLIQAKHGEIVSLGSFSAYATADVDD